MNTTRTGSPSQGATDTQEVVRRYFERIMELRPVEATCHGLHEHDHRWPVAGLSAAQELRDVVRSFESALGGRNGGHADLDRDLARYAVALMRFQLEEIRLGARMPEAPEQVGNGVFLLFARDFAPVEERLERIAARLEALPAYLAASREELTEPVRLWTEIGLDSARQLPALFGTVVAAAPEGTLRRRLEAAATSAVQAVDEYCRWLGGHVLPAAADDGVIGEEGFSRLLELRRLPHAPDQILELGRRYLAEVKAKRAALLADHWPGRSLQEVDALVRAERPTSFEAALDEYADVIASARDFVTEHSIATVPPSEELHVAATPSFLRAVIPFAAYEPPAHFDARQLGIYMVTPHGRDLGEHNHAAVLNTSVHEGYPGHHLQFACANHHPSLARLLSADQAHEYVEGWAHYSEQLMYEQGFSAGPEVRFVQLNDLAWRACRIVIDVELSCGRMGFDEAVEMLVREAAMSRAGAVAEVRRYTYTPGYQLSYLYGKHLLLELRERRRRAEGVAFDLRRFHDRLLYAGAVPASTWDSLFESDASDGPTRQ